MKITSGIRSLSGGPRLKTALLKEMALLSFAKFWGKKTAEKSDEVSGDLILFRVTEAAADMVMMNSSSQTSNMFWN